VLPNKDLPEGWDCSEPTLNGSARAGSSKRAIQSLQRTSWGTLKYTSVPT